MAQNDTLSTVIHMLVGLPASGKTYYAIHNKFKGEEEHSRVYIDFDRYMENGGYPDLKTIWNKEFIYWRYIVKDLFIMDGLFLTDDVRIKVLKSFIGHIKNEVYKRGMHDAMFDITVVLHVWNEDRETCIANDVQREGRPKSSYNTIKYAKYEMPDACAITEALIHECAIVNVEIEHHTVKKLNIYEKYFKPYTGISEDEHTMMSDIWTNGGTAGNCWDDNLGTVDPEEPLEFDKFDDLLETVCPNVPYLQYKKIRKLFVTLDTYDENDYYGGTVSYSKWICDVKELYKYLEDNNLIEIKES